MDKVRLGWLRKGSVKGLEGSGKELARGGCSKQRGSKEHREQVVWLQCRTQDIKQGCKDRQRKGENWGREEAGKSAIKLAENRFSSQEAAASHWPATITKRNQSGRAKPGLE